MSTPGFGLKDAFLIQNRIIESGRKLGTAVQIGTFGRHTGLVQLTAAQAQRIAACLIEETGVQLELADFQSGRTALDDSAQRVARVVHNHRHIAANRRVQWQYHLIEIK